LARLIRERPLFVNLASFANPLLRNGAIGANNSTFAVFSAMGTGSALRAGSVR
jgi:hypothetical protein